MPSETHSELVVSSDGGIEPQSVSSQQLQCLEALRHVNLAGCSWTDLPQPKGHHSTVCKIWPFSATLPNPHRTMQKCTKFATVADLLKRKKKRTAQYEQSNSRTAVLQAQPSPPSKLPIIEFQRIQEQPGPVLHQKSIENTTSVRVVVTVPNSCAFCTSYFSNTQTRASDLCTSCCIQSLSWSTSPM